MPELFVIDEDDEDSPAPPETDHLLMLSKRLKGLIVVLAKKLTLPAVAHYCRLLANTVEQLAPFYKVTGLLPRGQLDRDDSGFPCTEDLYFLFSEWRTAERGLKTGVSDSDLLKQLRQKIFAGVFPSEEHASLARRHHLIRIHGAEIAEEFRVLHPIMLKETETLRFYKLGWRGWDERAGLFRYCTTIFTQDVGARPLEEVRKDSGLYERIRTEFIRPLPEMLETLHFREDVHPKSLDRYTIGPYYAPGSANSMALKNLFDGLEHPFILKLSLERLIMGSSVSPQRYSEDMLDEDAPRSGSIVEQRTRYVLCSPDLKDRLNGSDEKGEPATIFTYGRRGEIV